MNSRKILMQTSKWSTSSKITDFKSGGKSPIHPFSCVESKFKCLKLTYRWKGNFIRINIVLRAKFQKWTYFELLIENRKGTFLKVVGFLLKIVTICKNDLS